MRATIEREAADVSNRLEADGSEGPLRALVVRIGVQYDPVQPKNVEPEGGECPDRVATVASSPGAAIPDHDSQFRAAPPLVYREQAGASDDSPVLVKHGEQLLLRRVVPLELIQKQLSEAFECNVERASARQLDDSVVARPPIERLELGIVEAGNVRPQHDLLTAQRGWPVDRRSGVHCTVPTYRGRL